MAKASEIARALAVVGLLAACADPLKVDPAVDGGRELPDGFVVGCITPLDCDDGDPCTGDRCEAAGCSYTPKSCEAFTDACNTGVCDGQDGTCKAKPADDGTACAAPGGAAGRCLTGVCLPRDQCAPDPRMFNCTLFDQILTDSTSGLGAIDAYTCAGSAGLTGAEHAYRFNLATDNDVKLTLTGTGAAADLDLLVLDGAACSASASCVAAALTLGSGAETLTFPGRGGRSYAIVVDGRGGASGDYTLKIGCTAGTCKPIKTLACNQSVMGDTSSASATDVISDYDCTSSTLSGPEDTYLVTQTAKTSYMMKLSGLTTDLDLIVTTASASGDCDPESCRGAAIHAGLGDETLAWTGYPASTNHVMIDSNGPGGPYLLEVSCAP